MQKHAISTFQQILNGIKQTKTNTHTRSSIHTSTNKSSHNHPPTILSYPKSRKNVSNECTMDGNVRKTISGLSPQMGNRMKTNTSTLSHTHTPRDKQLQIQIHMPLTHTYTSTHRHTPAKRNKGHFSWHSPDLVSPQNAWTRP